MRSCTAFRQSIPKSIEPLRHTCVSVWVWSKVRFWEEPAPPASPPASPPAPAPAPAAGSRQAAAAARERDFQVGERKEKEAQKSVWGGGS